jgi:hypothetical protein
MKHKRKSPRLGERIDVRIPSDILARIDAFAAAELIHPRASALRRLIIRGLEYEGRMRGPAKSRVQ